MNNHKFFFAISVFIIILVTKLEANFYKTHAILDPKHISAKEDFFNKVLKTNSKYDVQKIKLFIQVLNKEMLDLQKDLYETELLENLELKLKKRKKAIKKSKEDSQIKKAPLLRVYKEHLIPLMEILLEKSLEKNENTLEQTYELDAIVDAFYSYYIPFMIPNAHRSIWPTDIDLLFIGKHFFKSYSFKENDTKKVEANNLISEKKFNEEIASCLGYKVNHHFYLKEEELKNLKKCGFDISKLNPGPSLIWSSHKEKNKSLEDLFPSDNETIYFKNVGLRGLGTPKIKAYFLRDGKKKKLKIKMGIQIYSEFVISKIYELIGLSRDQIIRKEKIKLYLEDTSYEEFKSQFANKNQIPVINQFVSELGHDEKGQWILLEDILLEANPKNELRTSPIDISSWDLSNRREYRSLLMLFSWLGINDIKPSNFKYILYETEDGLIPHIRHHDLGCALGGPFYLRKAKQVLSLMKQSSVNDFPEHFLSSKKNQIKIHWNDFANRKRTFVTSTWYDLKWMARKILALSEEDINSAFQNSLIPKDVTDLYLIKIKKRRNEILKAFSLEKEFPLFKTPDLKNYSPNKNIKDGKIIKTLYEGKNTSHLNPNKWSTFIQSLINLEVPVGAWNIQGTQQTTKSWLEGASGFGQSLNINSIKDKTSIMTFNLGFGIQAIATRKVLVNKDQMNTKDKMRLYQIIDCIKFRIGIESKLLQLMLKKLPIINGNLIIKFLEKSYTHIHFSDKIKEAYLSKFKLFKIIKNTSMYSIQKLEKLDAIIKETFLGLDFSTAFNLKITQPFINSGFRTDISNFRIKQRIYTRDEFNQLHYIYDTLKINKNGGGINLLELNAPLLNPALFKIAVFRNSYDYELYDYIILKKVKNRYNHLENQKSNDFNLEIQNLKYIKKHKTHPKESLSSLYYKISSKGEQKLFESSNLFFMNSFKYTQNAKSHIKDSTNKHHIFSSISYSKSKSLGFDNFNNINKFFDLTTKKRGRIRIVHEKKDNLIDESVFILRSEDYFRTRKNKKIYELFEDLNFRYSKNENTKFFDPTKLPYYIKIEKFPKVYAQTRVFISGKELYKKIIESSLEKTKNILFKHFNRVITPNILNTLFLKNKVNSLIRTTKNIKKTPKNSYLISKEIIKLLYKLDTKNLGIYFLKEFLDETHFFVTGEISGLLRSYSTTQDLQQEQTRRFMAESWGKYPQRPPIQKFLRFNRYITNASFIHKLLSDSYSLGTLETSMANNLENMYSHNHNF